MVVAMPILARKLLSWCAPAGFLACGTAFLVAGWPAGLGWSLIVVSLGWAAERVRMTTSQPPWRSTAPRAAPR